MSSVLTVGFQGEHGAYSELALREFFFQFPSPSSESPKLQSVPLTSFKSCFDALTVSKTVDCVVLPMENSLGGSLFDNYEMLTTTDTTIVGEHVSKIQHCLLALPSATLSSIKEAYSHPQALIQSTSFLKEHDIKPIEHYDTAGAAKYIASQRDTTRSAVASRWAAEIYNLQILSQGIEDEKYNCTRFFCITNKGVTLADLLAKLFAVSTKSSLNIISEFHATLGKKGVISLTSKGGCTAFLDSFTAARHPLITTSCTMELRKLDIRPAKQFRPECLAEEQEPQENVFPYIYHAEIQAQCSRSSQGLSCICLDRALSILQEKASFSKNHGVFAVSSVPNFAPAPRSETISHSSTSSELTTFQPPPISRVVNSMVTSGTAAVAELAQTLIRSGLDVISLSVGEPAVGPSKVVSDASAEAYALGKTKYTATTGSLELRKAISGIYPESSASQICVSNGAKQGLYQTIAALCNPEDIVLIPTPCWVSYTEMCVLVGCQYELISTDAKDGYALQPRQLAEMLKNMTAKRRSAVKAILFCNPNNPTGGTYSSSDVEEIGKVMQKYVPKAVLIADEVYEHLAYDVADENISESTSETGLPLPACSAWFLHTARLTQNQEEEANVLSRTSSSGTTEDTSSLTHTTSAISPYRKMVYSIVNSMYSEEDGSDVKDKFASTRATTPLRDRVVVVSGLSKGFAMTGLRIGYTVAPEWLAPSIAKIQGQLTSCACSVSQHAALRVLETSRKQLVLERNIMLSSLKQKRDKVIEALRGMPLVSVDYSPRGAFYVVANVSRTFGKRSEQGALITDSTSFCSVLLKENLVALVPGDAFFVSEGVRIVFALEMDVVMQAMQRMKEFCEGIRD